MNNKVTFGLRNVHYSLASLSEDGESWIFAEPKKLKGAQEVSTELIGGATQVYADDQVYATLISNAGSNVTLKLTEVDDEFKKDIFGYEEDSNGNLIELTDAKAKTFALGYEIQGDAKARRIWYYLCTATPIGSASKSKTDSIEANAVSLTITARPIDVSGRPVLRAISNNGDTNYETFLETTPALPVLTANTEG